jgi:cyclic pyranopterin phosphate synthase
MLVDRFGRRHNNLRISVTDRCNLRCTYCMTEDVEFLPRGQLLTFEEIHRFAHVAATLGVDKIRLTGGEPLLRADLPRLVAMLVAIPGVKDVGLTTNGLLLAKLAEPLFDAGLRRLNVSLDTLDPEQFRRIARRDGLEQVLDGLAAAKRLGFGPIKLNAVAMKGVNEDQLVPLARFCRAEGFEMRYIEFMPLEADGIWKRSEVVVAADILRMLSEAGLPTVPAERDDPHAPATDFDYEDGGGRVGVIASVSQPFCGSCNRIRLTAEGKLRYCLFALEETDVRALLRSGGSDADLAKSIANTVAGKWAGHDFNSPTYIRPERTMHTIGG